eukprot:TRINITY_DN65105_c0_g1_i3.p1 TRINITY_DN65105_c0_g1~~TRINITY_DN65105_c0_g1_i3.p1  ORF type:complete len:215 (-),score=16.15 TRINITY_DN65105_c0_g1_i3:514-1158(-)
MNTKPPTTEPVVIGSLQVDILELKEVDLEAVCYVKCIVGTTTHATQKRLCGSKIDERIFFPVTKHAEHNGALCLELWLDSKKLGAVERQLQNFSASPVQNDLWLEFEKFGSIHVLAHYHDFTKLHPRTKTINYGGMSLRDVYLHQCMNHAIKKPNSAFLAMLPTTPNLQHELETVRLNNNMLGDKGIILVMETMKNFGTVTQENFHRDVCVLTV